MTSYKHTQISEKTFSITADVDGQEINFLVVVTSSETEIQELVDFYINGIKNPTSPALPTYAQLRVQAYPSFPDQFDLIYHGGVVAWKEAIAAIKAEYPKP